MMASGYWPSLDCGRDHVELGQEPARERHARLGQEEHQHGPRQQRPAAGQAPDGTEVVAGLALPLDQFDHREAADDDERVGEKVEEGAGRAVADAAWTPTRT